MGLGIPNPTKAFGYSTDVASEPNVQVPVYNGGSAAIAAGDVVTLDATMTTSQNFHVKQADVSADDPATVVGVAAEAIAAGKTGMIVIFGYAEVNVGDSSSITAGQLATFHGSTDGAASNATADASSIVGDYFGKFLGAEDAAAGTNKAPVWVFG